MASNKVWWNTHPGFHMGENNPMYGHKDSEETRKKRSQSALGNQNPLGNKHSEERKERERQMGLLLQQNKRWNKIVDQFIEGKSIKDWIKKPSLQQEWRDPKNEYELNERFLDSERHHLTKWLVAFIPKEWNQEVRHNLMTGYGMSIINDMTVQFLFKTENPFKH